MADENNHSKPALKVGDVYFFNDDKKSSLCGPCGHRSSLERLLILLLLVVTGASIIVIVVLATANTQNRDEDLCLNADCVKAASRMFESMDTTVDPCVDFFEYACGAWNREHVIPDDRSTYDTFSKLRDRLQITLKALLEEESPVGEASAVTKAKAMYRSCSNMDAIENLGTRPLTDLFDHVGNWPVLSPQWEESAFQLETILSQLKLYNRDVIIKLMVRSEDKNSSQNALKAIEVRGDQPIWALLDHLGGWPVLDPDWDGSTMLLEEMLAKLRLYNNRIFVNQWISSDDKNSSLNILQIDQAGVGLGARDYFLRGRNDTQLMAYQQYATDVAILLGASREVASREMEEMIDFEIALANMTTPDEDRRDSEALYNRMTIGALYTNITDRFDWLRYLNLVFANVSIELTNDEPIVVYAPEYLRKVVDFIHESPKRIVANYMVWRIVMNRVSNLPQAFLDVKAKFAKAMYGVATHRPRWRSCITSTNENFGMAVGSLFVKTKFDEHAKSVAMEMIGNIRDAFNELLSDVEWMDDETREVAREKADSISEKIGYPEYILNATQLNEDYADISIDPDQYFENILRSLNFVAATNLRKIHKPVNMDKWFTSPAIVNAFYSGTKNQIMFPAAIFQPPFYHKNYPKYMNYGNIGMVIGHEITHGFDDTGRQFDKNGNLRQWWSKDVVRAFKERAQCIVEQYGNYTVPEVGMNLNGKNTQGENIADNGGLKQAFKAYRDWVKSNGREEPRLPGLKFSNNQVFFINFAQIWCGTARKEGFIQAISSGRHSPGRFRVIGTLSNMHDFADAFQCSADSPMNPTKKCKVW